MSDEPSEKLTIRSVVYNENGDDSLKDTPFNVTWKLTIPQEEGYKSLIESVHNIVENLPEEKVRLTDVSYKFKYPDSPIAAFEISTLNGKELHSIAKDIFKDADIDMENLYATYRGKFSLRGLKTEIEKVEADIGRLR